MAYRPLRLCAGGGGIEAVPDRPRTIDLGAVRGALEALGITVIDARVVLIAATTPEVTISRSGRLLFKTTSESAAATLLETMLGLPGLREPRTAGAASRPR